MNWELLGIIAGACWLLGFFVVCLLRKKIWIFSFSLSFDISSVSLALIFSFLGSVAGVLAGLSTFIVGIAMFADGGFKEDPSILAYAFVAIAVFVFSAVTAIFGLSIGPRRSSTAQANS